MNIDKVELVIYNSILIIGRNIMWKEINELSNKEWEISQKIKEGKKSCDGWVPAADGIINIENYLTAPYKIIWILKEPNYSRNIKDYGVFEENAKEEMNNRKEGRKDLVHSIVPGKWDIEGIWSTMVMDDMYISFDEKTIFPFVEKTARPVMLVSYTIFKFIITRNIDIPNYIEDDMIRALKSIAVVNIKKAPGGGKPKKDNNGEEYEIKEAYKNNEDILKEQIKVYKPQIIIGVGDEKNNTLNYILNNIPEDILCVKAHHPASLSFHYKNDVHFQLIKEDGYYIAQCEQEYIKKIVERVENQKRKNGT
jgi:hypothetical protein